MSNVFSAGINITLCLLLCGCATHKQRVEHRQQIEALRTGQTIGEDRKSEDDATLVRALERGETVGRTR